MIKLSLKVYIHTLTSRYAVHRAPTPIKLGTHLLEIVAFLRQFIYSHFMVMPWKASHSTFARHLELQVTYFILHVTFTELVLGEVLGLL